MSGADRKSSSAAASKPVAASAAAVTFNSAAAPSPAAAAHAAGGMIVRVVLPAHLRDLARTDREVRLTVEAPLTQRRVLDELERRYPALIGTIRDRDTHLRRPLLRFFACGEDLSHDPIDNPLPPEVADAREPFIILGAIAGG